MTGRSADSSALVELRYKRRAAGDAWQVAEAAYLSHSFEPKVIVPSFWQALLREESTRQHSSQTLKGKA